MVEKITVSPQEVRGYGNVVDEKELDDYESHGCTLESGYDVIKGVEERVFNLSRHLYSPVLDGREPAVTLVEGYEFSIGNGIAGGYHQVGYVGDGFANSGDWELSMTLRTSNWDGGFSLFLEPYPLQECPSQSNKWDCIFANGQEDMLQWIDGYVKINKGNGLTNTGIRYTRNATMSVKMVKEGTTFKYYENDDLKGTYVWSKLGTASRVYLGVSTWGGSGSVNTFADVEANPL